LGGSGMPAVAEPVGNLPVNKSIKLDDSTKVKNPMALKKVRRQGAQILRNEAYLS
jgi:hypothetical protein